MPVQLAAALGDRERLRFWLRRLEEDHSTLYLYLPLSASYLGETPEIAKSYGTGPEHEAVNRSYSIAKQ
jgi:hypothetical protein